MNRGQRIRNPTYLTLYEYRSLIVTGTIDPEQRAELERHDWELFSICGPASSGDRQRAFHFRRRLQPERLPIRRRS